MESLSLSSTSASKMKKATTLARNNAKWDKFKDEIFQFYLTEDNTLESTMQMVQTKYNFKASLRKWKMKTKEWGFEKNVSKRDMQGIISTAEKRLSEEKKDTAFFYHGRPISIAKIANCKRRKTTPSLESPSSEEISAAVTYSTPRSEDNSEQMLWGITLVTSFQYIESSDLGIPTQDLDNCALSGHRLMNNRRDGAVIISVSKSAHHNGILCDGPLCDHSSPHQPHIEGDRYRCVICINIDFCGSCMVEPSNSHDRSHPFIMFKTPVADQRVFCRFKDESTLCIVVTCRNLAHCSLALSPGASFMSSAFELVKPAVLDPDVQYRILHSEHDDTVYCFQPDYIRFLILHEDFDDDPDDLETILLADWKERQATSGPISLVEKLGKALARNKDYLKAFILARILTNVWHFIESGYTPKPAETVVGDWLFEQGLHGESIPFLKNAYFYYLEALSRDKSDPDKRPQHTANLLRKSYEMLGPQKEWLGIRAMFPWPSCLPCPKPCEGVTTKTTGKIRKSTTGSSSEKEVADFGTVGKCDKSVLIPPTN